MWWQPLRLESDLLRNLDLFKAVLKSEHLGREGEEWDELEWEKTSYAFATFYFSTRGHEANIERCSDWLNLRDGNLGVIIVFAFFWMSDVFHLKTIKQQNKAKSNSCLARQWFFFFFPFPPLNLLDTKGELSNHRISGGFLTNVIHEYQPFLSALSYDKKHKV